MNTAIHSAVIATTLAMTALTADAASFAFKRPLTNSAASDTARCGAGDSCAVAARVMLDIQNAKAGASSGNATLTTAQWEVANLNWQVRKAAYNIAYSHGNCNTSGDGTSSTCSSVSQIGQPTDEGFRYQTFNLQLAWSGQAPSAAVCAVAATLGVSCFNGYISTTFNAGNSVALDDHSQPGDTAHLLDPGVAP